MNIDKREHLLEVLKDFDVAMLSTRTDTGDLQGRPMGLAGIHDDGIVYLAAKVTSDKVKQLELDPHVGLTVQGKIKFASLSGRAKVNRERSLIDSLWKESWKIWFPEGKDDPDLCLIEFDATEGEYWDEAGAKGIKFLIKAAKAYLTGEEPKGSAESNAKVSL